MAPAPPVAAESLREATKISLVDLVVHLPTQPIPPDPKTADSVAAQPVDPPALASSKPDDKPPSDDGHSPDASTKDPVPPDIPSAEAAGRHVSPSSPRHPAADIVVLPRLPKPPKIHSVRAGPVHVQDLAGMVQRRRNALRRITQKEKVDGARGRALASRGAGW
ncbi:hypothetical protein B0H10DRAFT_2221266 [Mycena sp. CBHHK59/15]|nr:hypothetical protein B0H10DRAFT_2221266 [Mycena sp. CBHHK59/15]